MIHNDVIRALRHILNIPDQQIVEILALADKAVSLDDVKAYLKSENEAGFKECGDDVMAPFLDGLVFFKRGKDESKPRLSTRERISNNMTIKKLRVAFELKELDIIALIGKAGLKISKTEVNAFFRHPDHRNYRVCGDQFLRNLLKGLST